MNQCNEQSTNYWKQHITSEWNWLSSVFWGFILANLTFFCYLSLVTLIIIMLTVNDLWPPRTSFKWLTDQLCRNPLQLPGSTVDTVSVIAQKHRVLWHIRCTPCPRATPNIEPIVLNSTLVASVHTDTIFIVNSSSKSGVFRKKLASWIPDHRRYNTT